MIYEIIKNINYNFNNFLKKFFLYKYNLNENNKNLDINKNTFN
jgi:hypothetical protein